MLQKETKNCVLWFMNQVILGPTKLKAVESIDELEELKKIGIPDIFTEYPEKL